MTFHQKNTPLCSPQCSSLNKSIRLVHWYKFFIYKHLIKCEIKNLLSKSRMECSIFIPLCVFVYFQMVFVICLSFFSIHQSIIYGFWINEKSVLIEPFPRMGNYRLFEMSSERIYIHISLLPGQDWLLLFSFRTKTYLKKKKCVAYKCWIQFVDVVVDVCALANFA